MSVGLLAWLLKIVPFAELVEALAGINWQLLVPATILMIVALYFWDAICLRVLFVVDDRLVPFKQSLAVRGRSYLLGALNYELGQGAIAWSMARLQKTSFLAALSRSVLLAYHDLLVLLLAGLIGASLGDDIRLARIRLICSIGLGVLLIVTGALVLASKWYGRWLLQTKWGAWMDSWSWRRSFQLGLLRIFYFGILVAYGVVAVHASGTTVGLAVAASAIPVVLLADGLPSVAGLGTRETALLLLLSPPQPERLLAMSLVWSSGLIIGRVVIGLVATWAIPRAWHQPPENDTTVSTRR